LQSIRKNLGLTTGSCHLSQTKARSTERPRCSLLHRVK